MQEIKLRCPQCRRELWAKTDPSDPPKTAVVECLCDRCDDGGGFPETNYYDSQGRQLAPSQ